MKPMIRKHFRNPKRRRETYAEAVELISAEWKAFLKEWQAACAALASRFPQDVAKEQVWSEDYKPITGDFPWRGTGRPCGGQSHFEQGYGQYA